MMHFRNVVDSRKHSIRSIVINRSTAIQTVRSQADYQTSVSHMPDVVNPVIAVFDLLNQQMVFAVGGKRSDYRPLSVSFPAMANRTLENLAEEIFRQFRITCFYIADLDAIQGQANSVGRLFAKSLLQRGWHVWLDVGIKDHKQQRSLQGLSSRFPNQFHPILATESFASVEDFMVVCDSLESPGQWTVSMDLITVDGHLNWFRPTRTQPWVASGPNDGGWPRSDLLGKNAWKDVGVLQFAGMCVQRNIQQFIVLSLTDVGQQAGSSTLDLLQRMKSAFPEAGLVSGGGVRDATDLEFFRNSGARHVLVGTWLWRQWSTGKMATQPPGE